VAYRRSIRSIQTRDAGVPVIVHASETGTSERIEDFPFPVYRYFVNLRSADRPIKDTEKTSS
jgi:hypothetical protein